MHAIITFKTFICPKRNLSLSELSYGKGKKREESSHIFLPVQVEIFLGDKNIIYSSLMKTNPLNI
jgi:hypothetical protein